MEAVCSHGRTPGSKTGSQAQPAPTVLACKERGPHEKTQRWFDGSHCPGSCGQWFQRRSAPGQVGQRFALFWLLFAQPPFGGDSAPALYAAVPGRGRRLWGHAAFGRDGPGPGHERRAGFAASSGHGRRCCRCCRGLVHDWPKCRSRRAGCPWRSTWGSAWTGSCAPRL